MANETPSGRADAEITNVYRLPIAPRVPNNDIVAGGTKDETIATVTQLFRSKKSPTTSRSKFTDVEDMHMALTRHALELVVGVVAPQDRELHVRFKDELSSRLLQRKRALMPLGKVSPDIDESQIKEIKHGVLVDIIIALGRLGVFRTPPINLKNYDSSLRLLKSPIDDTRIHIMSLYQSMFENKGGLMSSDSFCRVSAFLHQEYWLKLKKNIKQSPEYCAVQSLVDGDFLERNFLESSLLEYLTEDNNASLFASWGQYQSVVDFVLAAMRGKTQDGKMREAGRRVVLRREEFTGKIKRLAQIGSREGDRSKERFVSELKQETDYMRTLIQQDILELEGSNNVVVLSARMGQLQDEKQAVTQVEKEVERLAVEDSKIYQKTFADMLQFLVDDPLKRTRLYRSLSKWSSEMVNDFADWLYEAIQDETRIDESFSSSRELFRKKVGKVIARKKSAGVI